MKEQKEFHLQQEVCSYLRWKYKDVFFLSDTIASVKLTIPQQLRNKSIQCPSFNCPDLILFKRGRGYIGLFFEFKKESPYKKDGELYTNTHLKRQAETIIELQKIGYYASFEWDYETITKKIDWYLSEI